MTVQIRERRPRQLRSVADPPNLAAKLCYESPRARRAPAGQAVAHGTGDGCVWECCIDGDGPGHGSVESLARVSGYDIVIIVLVGEGVGRGRGPLRAVMTAYE